MGRGSYDLEEVVFDTGGQTRSRHAPALLNRVVPALLVKGALRDVAHGPGGFIVPWQCSWSVVSRCRLRCDSVHSVVSDSGSLQLPFQP